MSQIRSALDKALPERLPAPDWDSHDLENRAVTSMRRRRLGGGLLGVVVLGLSALLAVTLLPGPATDRPAADAKREYPLPELDESQPYHWLFTDWSTTEATETLDRALTEHLEQEHSQLRAQGDVGFLRTQRQLWTAVAVGEDYEAGPQAKGSREVYQQPMYILGAVPDKPGISLDTGTTTEGERLTVAVYPKGGFATGTADASDEPEKPPPPQYLVEGCQGYKSHGEIAVSFECDKVDVGTELSALAVKRTVLRIDGDEADDAFEVTRTVVRYRDDGTAVVVAMSVDAPKAIGPSLTTAELLGIAAAIPDVAVT